MTQYNSKQLWIWLGLWGRMENKTEGSDKEDPHPKNEDGEGLMKWFPLLFANAKTVFFTSSIFDNIAIWQALSPAIFRHYTANDS